MARYGLNAPATGFTFNVLNLLQTLEHRPELEASTARDFLLFNTCDDRREVLEIATLLRLNGYTTARDIIRRDYDKSLEYARRMNIRCMLVIGEESRGYMAVRTSDGVAVSVDKTRIGKPQLIKYIEESQGDNVTWQT
jgi:ATP phosphoribosyltransferase regulatory subunit